MRAMPTAMPPEPSPATGPRRFPARPRPSWLLWGGGGACAGGMVGHGLLEAWAPSRFVALVVVAGLASALAWALRRFAGMALAHGLAIAWLVALALLGGPLPLLATALAALAAIALGGLLLPRADAAAQGMVGIALGAGVLGWLLPWPLHMRATWLGAALLLVAWRHRALHAGLRALAGEWRRTVADAPRATALAVLVLGLASTGCWIPTSQHDDVGYHLLLPWSLQLDGRLAMDPDVHAWALAPWASDVVHAVPQLIAGAESRGAVNALWLVLGAIALWRLCAALGGGLRARALAVALFASLPLTAALAMGMQTELATAATLAWAALAGLQPPSRRQLLAGCALLGLLVATKLAAAGFALVLLPWLAWRHRRVLDPATVAAGLLLVAALGGASYAYAWSIAGNPVLPLMNDVFGSPWFGGRFEDTRWATGVHPALPWSLTFRTDRYLEAYPGGGGFVLVALAGAWLLALWQRPTRALAALSLLMVLGLLVATQYFRYVYPPLVLALPALVVAAMRAAPRGATALVLATCAANLLFQANAHWMLRTGAVKDAVAAAGRDGPVLSVFAPERLVAAAIRARWADDGHRPGAVLALQLDFPLLAELGSAARTTTWYDPSLASAAAAADRDDSGEAWVALWRREGIADLVVREPRLSPAQAAALVRAGAERQFEVNGVAWFRLPGEDRGAAP